MRRTQNQKKMKTSKRRIFIEALRTFALSVGVTALCMLVTVSLLGLESPAKTHQATEASVFNAPQAREEPREQAAARLPTR